MYLFKTNSGAGATGIFLPTIIVMSQKLLQTAPKWVHWLAQDRNGAWWGFEQEPNEGAYSWYENEVGRYIKLSQDSPNPDWRDTLLKVAVY